MLNAVTEHHQAARGASAGLVHVTLMEEAHPAAGPVRGRRSAASAAVQAIDHQVLYGRRGTGKRMPSVTLKGFSKPRQAGVYRGGQLAHFRCRNYRYSYGPFGLLTFPPPAFASSETFAPV